MSPRSLALASARLRVACGQHTGTWPPPLPRPGVGGSPIAREPTARRSRMLGIHPRIVVGSMAGAETGPKSRSRDTFILEKAHAPRGREDRRERAESRIIGQPDRQPADRTASQRRGAVLDRARVRSLVRLSGGRLRDPSLLSGQGRHRRAVAAHLRTLRHRPVRRPRADEVTGAGSQHPRGTHSASAAAGGCPGPDRRGRNAHRAFAARVPCASNCCRLRWTTAGSSP